MGEDRLLRMPGGITATVLRSTEETGGALFEIEALLPPGAKGPPAHIHLGQQESFSVLAGLMDVRTGKEWLRLGPGETASVEPGTVHTFRNRTDRPVRMITQMTPALLFEHMMRIQAGSRVPPVLRIAAINHGPDASFFLAGLPIGVQRVLWNGLARLSRRP